MDSIFAIVKLQCHMLIRKILKAKGTVLPQVSPFLATFFMGSIKSFCFCTIFSYLLIFPLMQKEFWLQVIRRHRRAGLILYLQVGHHHFPMLLRLMVPFQLQCHPAPSLMVLPPLLFMSSNHHLHKPQPFSLCRCHHLDNKHGINNSKVNQ